MQVSTVAAGAEKVECNSPVKSATAPLRRPAKRQRKRWGEIRNLNISNQFPLFIDEPDGFPQSFANFPALNPNSCRFILRATGLIPQSLKPEREECPFLFNRL